MLRFGGKLVVALKPQSRCRDCERRLLVPQVVETGQFLGDVVCMVLHSASHETLREGGEREGKQVDTLRDA